MIYLISLIVVFNIILFFVLYKFKKISYKAIFCLCVLSGVFLFWSNIVLSSDVDSELSKYFMPGTLDDFYTPMMKTMDNTYVDPHYSDYPPFPNLIYQVFRQFISDENLAVAHNMETRLAGSQYLSTTMGGKLIPVIFYMITFVLLSLLLEYKLNNKSSKFINKLLILTFLISGPFIFIIQRGNNIILPIILITVYLMFYESNNKVYREIAVICLAFATALKMYPVFFGILLLKKGNKNLVIRTILYGLIAMFGFFVFYRDQNVLLQFIQNIIERNAYKESTIYGYNYSISFFASIRLIFVALGGDEGQYFSKLIYLIPLCISIMIYFTSKRYWQKLISISLLMIWIPSASYTYLLCFFLFPILLFMEEEHHKYDFIYLTCFILMFVPYNLDRITGFFMNARPEMQVTWGMVILHVALWIMVFTMIIENMYHLFKDYKLRSKD